MENKILLHYAKGEDVKKIDIQRKELAEEVDRLCFANDTSSDKVYLFIAHDADYFLFVTKSYLEIEELIKSHKRLIVPEKFLIQEFDSFEAAYKTAIEMKK
jgi:hypothetical protein